MSEQFPDYHYNMGNSLITGTYEEILFNYNFQFRREGFYFVIGDIPSMQGWMFFITVELKDFKYLLSILVPFLTSRDISFKVPVDRLTHESLIEGNLGFSYFGKVVCIYPKDQSTIVKLAKELTQITSFTKGTYMSGIFLGGLLYTRYGSFEDIITPEGNLIVNDKGEYEVDEFSIPYIIPKWLTWPFDEITTHIVPPPKKTLNGKYYILDILRDTPKGRVIFGIAKSNIFKFRKYLIKEGRPGIFRDSSGRDIIDRLNWQMTLHKRLQNKLLIPSFIDSFEDEGNSYLVLEYIDGMRFEKYIDSIFLSNSWIDLPIRSQELIFKNVLEILNIISALHQIKYVHRDISLGNFIVNKKGKIYLVDLELSYSLEEHIPAPPFQIGTPGYMSPEQRSGLALPNFNQDVYGLGALMLTIFTHLSPRKFYIFDRTELYNNIFFFTGIRDLSNLITNCLNVVPEKRPDIGVIKSELTSSLVQIKNKISPFQPLGKFDIENIINKGINSLKSSLVLAEEGLWLSQVSEAWEFRNTFIGIDKGISGILYTIGNLKKEGFKIDDLMPFFNKNWDFIKDHFLFSGRDLPSGLYSGGAGVAISISAAIDVGILPNTEENLTFMENCLFNVPVGLDIRNGLAGYGLSLLYCSKFLSPNFLNERIQFLIHYILNTQQESGGWCVLEGKKKIDLPKNFENGTAGIIFFLLEYIKFSNDENVRKKVIIALDRYSIQLRKEKISKALITLNGRAGWIMLFLKAFEILNNPVYENMAVKIVETIPVKPILNDFTFNNGLLGLGEVYLEGAKISTKANWKERVEWIAAVFKHSAVFIEDDVHWIQRHSQYPSADLMEGNSGIIHFFIKYSKILDNKRHTNGIIVF